MLQCMFAVHLFWACPLDCWSEGSSMMSTQDWACSKPSLLLGVFAEHWVSSMKTWSQRAKRPKLSVSLHLLFFYTVTFHMHNLVGYSLCWLTWMTWNLATLPKVFIPGLGFVIFLPLIVNSAKQRPNNAIKLQDAAMINQQTKKYTLDINQSV